MVASRTQKRTRTPKRSRNKKSRKSVPLKKINIKDLQSTEFYCVKCGINVVGKNVVVNPKPMPNGCPTLSGKCPKCNGKLFRIVSKDLKLK